MRAAILMYHAVGSSLDADGATVSEREFGRQMEYLARSKLHVVELEELVLQLKSGGQTQDYLVALTFDDGYQRSCEVICSILKRCNLPGTFFLIAGRMGQRADWIPGKDRLVSWREARAIVDAGFTIGSHAQTHRRLTELSSAEARREINVSKETLQDGLGVSVASFAYPFGSWDEHLRHEVAEAGYLAGCTTRSGFNTPAEDVFSLRRLDITGRYSLAMFKRSLSYGENAMPLSREIQYYSQRALRRLGLR